MYSTVHSKHYSIICSYKLARLKLVLIVQYSTKMKNSTGAKATGRIDQGILEPYLVAGIWMGSGRDIVSSERCGSRYLVQGGFHSC
jgi:hypothetical protein